MSSNQINAGFDNLMKKLVASNDLDEIHACQKELHYRIDSYVLEKEKILLKNKLLQLDIKSRPSSKKCFKTALVDKNGKNVGWWYGQFENQNIVMQMEIYDNQPPVFLKAGVDDKLMCGLPLNKTGLEDIQGAKIALEDFAKKWNRLGGKPKIYQ